MLTETRNETYYKSMHRETQFQSPDKTNYRQDDKLMFGDETSLFHFYTSFYEIRDGIERLKSYIEKRAGVSC